MNAGFNVAFGCLFGRAVPNMALMQCESDHNLENAVIQVLVRTPAATADQIAGCLGCEPEQVEHRMFYRRVLLARIARETDAGNELRLWRAASERRPLLRCHARRSH